MNVEVYHNVATDDQGRHIGMLDGYMPQHPIVMVAQFRYDELPSSYAAAEFAYRVLNVGDDPEFTDQEKPEAAIAREYRSRGNRSLSVGDVVKVEDDWLKCDHIGFSRLPAPPTKVVSRKVAGTTPIPTDS